MKNSYSQQTKTTLDEGGKFTACLDVNVKEKND